LPIPTTSPLVESSWEPSKEEKKSVDDLTDFPLDDWQKEVLAYEGNLIAVCGRRVGKTEVIGLKASQRAATRPNEQILVVAYTKEQAGIIFGRILYYSRRNHLKMIKEGRDRPTRTQIMFTNGSVVNVVACGLEGDSARGRNATCIIEDESSLISNTTSNVVLAPMLATNMDKSPAHIKIGTPQGMEDSHFYNSTLEGSGFKVFQISTWEVAEKRPEPQRSFMLKFLEQMKKVMTATEWGTEFGGQFLAESRRFFPEELIRKCCIGKREETPSLDGNPYYLGMDVGGAIDPSTFEIVKRLGKNNWVHCDSIATEKTFINETVDRAIQLNRVYDFKKIYLDDGGLGFGVLSYLFKEPATQKKTSGLNNSQRRLDFRGERNRKLLKEEMYINLKAMMERGYITLLDDDDLKASLMSISAVYDKDTRELKISGTWSHHTEGLIRAVWDFNEEKDLNLVCHWI
jgi:hypothetical protein